MVDSKMRFEFDHNALGSADVVYPAPSGNGPIRYVQDVSLASTSRQQIAQYLVDTYLAPRPTLSKDNVIPGGQAWISTRQNPTLWTEPSEPSTYIEPVLPTSYAHRDPAPNIPFKEISLQDKITADIDAIQSLPLALARRRGTARQTTKEFVRGKSGATPLVPGGEAWKPSNNPATMFAVQQACSGEWLNEIESGGVLPAVSAPGLDRGAFGAWENSSSIEKDVDRAAVGEDQDIVMADYIEDEGVSVNNEHLTIVSAGGETRSEQSKKAIQGLFDGVWLLEEEEEEEEPEEEEQANGTVSTEVSSAPQKPTSSSNSKTSTTTIAALVDLLPDFDSLPGGVEAAVDTSVINKVLTQPVASVWTSTASQHLGAIKTPLKGGGVKRRDDQWAVKATVPNLEAEFAKLKPSMAKTYPFELDTFQKEAIIHMEQGHSVFVAAHTSAGKTVAAEYAFALATKHCTRAIYTSPIKTISNQKFRDFSTQDFEVGLLTGDVSIKPESSCLIMTTEILRSMLYKGADMIRDIEWVIFDEVHYVNDAERGVVWEEVIIMLPEHVGLVLLSATVPNVMEFAGWVGRTKRKVVHVTGTTKRPVPLQHNVYYSGQLYVIAQGDMWDSKGYRQAREAQAKKNATPQTKAEAKAALPTGRGDGGRGRGGASGQQQQQQQQYRRVPPGSSAQNALKASISASGGGGGPQLRSEKSQWMTLIETLRKKDLIPMVTFCFSKKRCDALGDCLHSLDLTTSSEKSEIHVFCDRAFSRLNGTDRELPQVLRLREMLKRGIGVHHAGLLPIVKEVVEMLFCKGVLKVLFSTETFAMGVNAPARTVVFQSLRKHDGRQFRTLLPGEYTQMAGRAGRRGLDEVGTVIIACWDELPEETEIRRLLTGAATKLESQFRLTYSMILNILRVEDLTVEDMLKRSFAEFHAQRAQPEVQEALLKGQDALRRLRNKPWPVSPSNITREAVEQYHQLSAAIEDLDARLQGAVMLSRGAQQALTNGRVVQVVNTMTGVTELGAVIDANEGGSSSSAGIGKGGGKKRGVGLSLDSLMSTNSSSTKLSLEAASGTSEGGGKMYTVIRLHRPSPFDDSVDKKAAEAPSGESTSTDGMKATAATLGVKPLQGSSIKPSDAASDADLSASFGGMKLVGEKASEDDDLLNFGGGGKLKAVKSKKGNDDDDGLFLGMKPLSGKKGSGDRGGNIVVSTSTKGLANTSKESAAAALLPLPHQGVLGGVVYRIEHIPASSIAAICKVKVKLDAEDVLCGDAMTTATTVNALVTVVENAGGGDPPLMDPIGDLKLNSLELVGDIRQRAHLATLRASHPAHNDPILPEMLAIVRSEALLANRMAALARQTGDASLQQLPEFHQRVKVLQKLGYLDAQRVVTMKGRVACEINSGDELVATELIFGGVLADLSPEEAVALLSALVFQEKSQVEPELPSRLQQARDEAVSLAYAAGIVQKERGLDIVPEDYVTGSLKFGLMEVVYSWALGVDFKDICGLTDVMEGSIVRAMVRLDETCREFRDAARVMGNTELYKQMQAASEAIKRDVIFAASLYVA